MPKLSNAEKLKTAYNALESNARAMDALMTLLKLGKVDTILLTMRQIRERSLQIADQIKE